MYFDILVGNVQNLILGVVVIMDSYDSRSNYFLTVDLSCG